ncbi:hypothetical protein HDU89_007608 [Geranomyces variabilis]|nr:hypothetical protein HDU89_007608 [Geranomyces variabilis]
MQSEYLRRRPSVGGSKAESLSGQRSHYSSSGHSVAEASSLAAKCLEGLPDLQQASSAEAVRAVGSRVIVSVSSKDSFGQSSGSFAQVPSVKQMVKSSSKLGAGARTSAQSVARATSGFKKNEDVEAGIANIKQTAEDIVDDKLMRKAGGDHAAGERTSAIASWWKRWLSIRTTIIVLFLSALILNGLAIFIFMLLRNQENVSDLAQQIQGKIMESVVNRLLTRLRTAEASNRLNTALIKAGVLNVETLTGLRAYADQMIRQLSASPDVVSDAYVYPLNENGGGCWGAIYDTHGKLQLWNSSGITQAHSTPNDVARAYTWGLDSNGEFSLPVSNASAYIPYDDPNYEMVLVQNSPSVKWTSPWVWDVDNRVYVTLSQSAFNPAGKWVGIVGTELSLGSVSAILRDVAASASSEAVLFAVNRIDNTMIGASNLDVSFLCSGNFVNSVCNGTVTLLQPDSSNFPASFSDISALVEREYGGWAGLSDSRIFRDTIDGVATFINIAPLDTGPTHLEWAIVLTVSQSVFLARVNQSRNVAIGVFCALLVASMVITVFFAMRVTTPLADVTSRMNSLFKAKRALSGQGDTLLESEKSDIDLDKDASSLMEIKLLQQSFQQMKTTIRGFQRFVHPLVVERIVLDEPGAADICVARKEVSIFFSDIQDFTVLSERLPIAVLITILSRYLDFMTETISRYDGIVADFIGDAIMAFWEDNPEHATMAVRCALDQQAAMQTFNQMIMGKGYEPMSVRMGLHVGMVLVGNIGSVHRLKYGCVGDDVNLCSRLEGLNKRYNTKIVLSEESKSKLKPGVFETRALEQVIVKGRTTGTYLYELCGNRDTCDPAIVERNSIYANLMERVQLLDDVESEAGQELLEEMEDYCRKYPTDLAGTLLKDRLSSGELSGPVKLTEK